MSDIDQSDSWQFNKVVIECNKYMLEHKIATDVRFKVLNNLSCTITKNILQGDQNTNERQENCREFQAHRYMLISRSPVFYAMLCGDIAERGDVINIEDVEPDAFEQLLNYIYTDEVSLDKDLVMFILYASKKYMLPGLTTKCISYLLDQLNASNACLILDQSILFDECRLVNECMKIIMFETKNAMDCPAFLNIQVETLSYILNSKMFSIPEVQVYLKCVEWAKSQCTQQEIEATSENIREKLGECIYKISFPVIKSEDFACVVSCDKVLKPEEELQFFRYYCSQNEPSRDLDDSYSHKEAICDIPNGFASTDRYIDVDKLRQVIIPVVNNDLKSIPLPKSGECNFKFTHTCKHSIILKGFILCKFTSHYVNDLYNWENCDVTLNNSKKVSGSFYTPSHSRWKEIFMTRPLVLPAGSNVVELSFRLGWKFAAYATKKHEISLNVISVSKLKLIDNFISVKVENLRKQPEIPICGLSYALTSDIVTKYI